MPSRVRIDRIKPIFTAAKGLNFGFRLTNVPEAPFFNGVNTFQSQVHRVTLRFCKQNEASSGVRTFIKYHLAEIAQQNPGVVIYTQPSNQTTPTVRAEYANGRMVHINLKSVSLENVSQYMSYLLSRSGSPVEKLISRQSAATTSVQGEWSPYTFQDSEQNVTELPDAKFGKYLNKNVSATDYVKNLIKLER
uniref:L51_S25_CI-B8 domain-containing protein n=1 Tax=Rhabditophanes sp. KR3021 TaxID=114890 RepID=A0AC35U2U8_9BILA